MADLLDLCLDHGIDAHHLDGEINFDCPLCGDHKPRFYINSKSGLWTCFNCGERGNLSSFLMQVLGYDPFEAHHLAQKLGTVRSRPQEQAEKPDADLELPEGCLPLDNPSDPLQRPFWQYLVKRGVSIEKVRRYGMGFVLTGLYAYRVIVPVTQAGSLKGWVARAIISDAVVKVLMPPGMKSSHLLFNLDNVRGDEIVLVEGVFDALALPEKAAATLGAKLSPAQRTLLRQAGFRRVTFLWDPDNAGQEATKKFSAELVAAGFEVFIASLPVGTDPAEADSPTLKKVLGAAVRVELESGYRLRKIFRAKEVKTAE